MPSLVGEVMAVLHLVAAVVVGAWLGGAEAAAAAAVGMATVGLGGTVVMGRRAAAGMRRARAAAEVDWEVELQGDVDRMRREEAEAAAEVAAAAGRRQEMLRQIWEWEDVMEAVREEERAEWEERRRRSAERVRAGGG